MTPSGFRVTRERLVAALLIGVGAVLRLAHYFYGRALWRDEAALAVGVRELSAARLLGPLPYDQEAPPGFLLAEKGLVGVAGDGERVLRLLPLLTGLASLPLFFLLARRLLRPAAAWLALLLFAFSLSAVYYAAEAKPYGLDLALAVGLQLVAVRALDRDTPRAAGWIFGLAGGAALWLSFQAAFVVGGVVAAFLLRGLRDRRRGWVGAAAATTAVFGASAVVLYLLSLRRILGSHVMQSFWAPQFMPLVPRSLADLAWLPRHLHALFRMPLDLAFPVSLLAMALAAIGIVAMWRARDQRLGALLLPGILALAASAAHAYPFHGRLVLFLLPALALLVARGVETLWVRSSLARRGRWAAVALGLLVAAGSLTTLATESRPLLEREDVRPLLARLERDRRDGDLIFVYRGAIKSFDYYAERHRLGPADRIARGGGDPSEVRRFAGTRRLWVVVSLVPDPTLDNWRDYAAALGALGRCAAAVSREDTALFLCDLT